MSTVVLLNLRQCPISHAFWATKIVCATASSIHEVMMLIKVHLPHTELTWQNVGRSQQTGISNRSSKIQSLFLLRIQKSVSTWQPQYKDKSADSVKKKLTVFGRHICSAPSEGARKLMVNFPNELHSLWDKCKKECLKLIKKTGFSILAY